MGNMSNVLAIKELAAIIRGWKAHVHNAQQRQSARVLPVNGELNIREAKPKETWNQTN
jgi:hypothetical protein